MQRGSSALRDRENSPEGTAGSRVCLEAVAQRAVVRLLGALLRVVRSSWDRGSAAPPSSVRPELVAEIAFDGIQTSPRYPGGVPLRVARVLHYREDRTAAEADELAAALALRAYSSHHVSSGTTVAQNVASSKKNPGCGPLT
jgi:hypothetical protein